MNDLTWALSTNTKVFKYLFLNLRLNKTRQEYIHTKTLFLYRSPAGTVLYGTELQSFDYLTYPQYLE